MHEDRKIQAEEVPYVEPNVYVHERQIFAVTVKKYAKLLLHIWYWKCFFIFIFSWKIEINVFPAKTGQVQVRFKGK